MYPSAGKLPADGGVIFSCGRYCGVAVGIFNRVDHPVSPYPVAIPTKDRVGSGVKPGFRYPSKQAVEHNDQETI